MGKRKRSSAAARRRSPASASPAAPPRPPQPSSLGAESPLPDLAAAKAAALRLLEASVLHPRAPAPAPLVCSGAAARHQHRPPPASVDEPLVLSGSECLAHDAFLSVVAAIEQEYKSFHSATCDGPPVPRTAQEKTLASTLYYGELATATTTRSIASPVKLTFTISKYNIPDVRLSKGRIVSQAEVSDLDEDEYTDVFGVLPPEEAADAHTPATDDDDGDECKSMDLDLDQASPAPQPPPRSYHPAPQLPTTDKLAADTNTAQQQGGHGDGHSCTSEQQQQQRQLLMNALHAQYWAGYHSALLYKSLGCGSGGGAAIGAEAGGDGSVPRLDDGWQSGWEAALKGGGDRPMKGDV